MAVEVITYYERSQKRPDMTQSPQLTAISAEKFSGKAWRRYNGYAFAARENLISLVIAELAKAVPAMPLGFVQIGGGFQLVAITAIEPGVNLFVALMVGGWVLMSRLPCVATLSGLLMWKVGKKAFYASMKPPAWWLKADRANLSLTGPVGPLRR